MACNGSGLRLPSIHRLRPVAVRLFCALSRKIRFLIWRKIFGHFYRPRRSWDKVMFLQASVILSTGGGVCLSACWDASPPGPGRHPPGTRDLPTRQTHPPPPGPGRPPPWDQRPPLDQRPPREADASIRSMSGRYASYWNAFLFGECSDNSVNCNYSSCQGELFFKFLEIISTLTRFYNCVWIQNRSKTQDNFSVKKEIF